MPDLTTIPRVNGIDRETFQKEYVEPGRPVQIEGITGTWPAASKWSKDFLRREYGSARVPCLSLPPGQEPTFRGAPQYYDARPRLTMAEYLDYIETNPDLFDTSIQRYYLNNVTVSNPKSELNRLLEDTPMPPLFDHARLARIGMFIGYNTFSVLHYHPRQQSLATSVVGKKTIKLWSPDDFYACEPPPWYDHFGWSSNIVDPVHPDPQQHPAFAATRPLETTLEPGLLLFIPAHWYHLVEGEAFTMNLTFFWRAAPHECRPNLYRRDRWMMGLANRRTRLMRIARRLKLR